MDYGAISVDTSIFDEKGLKLESGILQTLEQFRNKPSRLILSEIVIREVQSHLKNRAKDARALTVKAIRESKESLSISDCNADIARNAIIPTEDDNSVADKRIKLFTRKTDAEIISATGRVKLDEIIKKYFGAEPPFEEVGTKKNEFPDAIALMSLESWAKENQTKVLAVAKDKDWRRFAEESEYIDVIEDLAEAISKFQPHSAAIEFCSYIRKELPLKKPDAIYDIINHNLDDQVAALDIYPDASSQFFIKPGYVELELGDFTFITDENGMALLHPVQGQNNTLVAEAKISILAYASTCFSLSVFDSVDKEHVDMGEASTSTVLEFDSEALLTFEGDFSGEVDDVELVDFKLLSYPSIVDFGDIEPDCWHEEQ